MEGPIPPSACISEDCLLEYQWEERPLVYEGLFPQCRGMPGQRSGSRCVSDQGKWGWDKEVLVGKCGKGIAFQIQIKKISTEAWIQKLW